jgi:hypothetical protein
VFTADCRLRYVTHEFVEQFHATPRLGREKRDEYSVPVQYIAITPAEFLPDKTVTLSSGNVSDHRGQDARNAGSSGPSSNENNTGMISFVLTLPLMSLLMTRSCWATLTNSIATFVRQDDPQGRLSLPLVRRRPQDALSDFFDTWIRRANDCGERR